VNRPGEVKTCRCPECGGRTDYDSAQVARYARAEGVGGERHWRGYDYIVCAGCGRAVLVPDGGGEPRGYEARGG
jgi:hypothetical protein